MALVLFLLGVNTANSSARQRVFRVGVTILGIFFNPGIQDIFNPGIPGFFGIVSANKTFVNVNLGTFREGIYVFNLILGANTNIVF